MAFWKFLFVSSFLCFSALSQVKVYFNQNSNTNYVDPYRNISRQGHNLESVIVDAIRSATKSVYVAVQELRLPNVAKELILKHQQGVDVRLVLENDYNFNILTQRDSNTDGEYEASKLSELMAFVDMNRDGRIQKEELEARDSIYMLEMAKVKIIDDTSDNSQGSGLMHHKFVIIDGKKTIVSSANFTMSCIHGDMLSSKSRGNLNSLVVIESSQVARFFQEEFLQLWGNGKRGNFGQSKTFRGHLNTSVKGINITIQFSPTSMRYNWEETVNGLIASQFIKANKSIKAALFVFSDQRLSNSLKLAQDRGARVGVIIEPKFAYRSYSELLDLMGLQMRDENCKIEPNNHPWEVPAPDVGMATLPQGDVLHHKFAVIDDHTVVMGSQNWSDAANFVNDETLIVIEDSKIADEYSREYERIKSRARLGVTNWLLDQIKRQNDYCNYNTSY